MVHVAVAGAETMYLDVERRRAAILLAVLLTAEERRRMGLVDAWVVTASDAAAAANAAAESTSDSRCPLAKRGFAMLTRATPPTAVQRDFDSLNEPEVGDVVGEIGVGSSGERLLKELDGELMSHLARRSARAAVDAAEVSDGAFSVTPTGGGSLLGAGTASHRSPSESPSRSSVTTRRSGGGIAAPAAPAVPRCH